MHTPSGPYVSYGRAADHRGCGYVDMQFGKGHDGKGGCSMNSSLGCGKGGCFLDSWHVYDQKGWHGKGGDVPACGGGGGCFHGCGNSGYNGVADGWHARDTWNYMNRNVADGHRFQDYGSGGAGGDFGCHQKGSGFRDSDFGCYQKGSGCRDSDFGCYQKGSGCRDSDFGCHLKGGAGMASYGDGNVCGGGSGCSGVVFGKGGTACGGGGGLNEFSGNGGSVNVTQSTTSGHHTPFEEFYRSSK